MGAKAAPWVISSRFSRASSKSAMKVTTTTGARFRYVALFASTTDAAIDALERFGFCKVSVEAMRE